MSREIIERMDIDRDILFLKIVRMNLLFFAIRAIFFFLPFSKLSLLNHFFVEKIREEFILYVSLCLRHSLIVQNIHRLLINVC